MGIRDPTHDTSEPLTAVNRAVRPNHEPFLHVRPTISLFCMSGWERKGEEVAIRFPLSLNQEFVCLFDQGGETGPFSSRYHITAGWRIVGKLDIGALQGALDDIVVRHEALRTLIVRQDGPRYQEVYPERPVKMIVRQLPGDNPVAREREAEKLLSDAEADAISPQEVPLFRCILGQFDDEDAALVIIAHHLASDGWSLEVIMRDVALRYAARCGHSVPVLPEVKQYREHVAREQESAADETLPGSLAYWQERLRGAQVFTIRTDWPRSAGPMPSTTARRFLVEPEAGSRVLQLARSMRGSPFMVLLAAFNLLACRMSGTRNIVVPTFTPGRSGELFADTVGSFFNFLPLRTDISGCATFREVLQRTRAACVSAYSHDIAQAASAAPELMGSAFDERQATCIFQVIAQLMPDGEKVGDLTYYSIRPQLDPQELTSDIPDGMLWTLRVSRAGEVFGDVRFKTNLFEADTVDEMIATYEQILRTAMDSSDAPLDEIQLPLLYV
jgi:condensation enzyme